jgi:hypothetical protein
MKTPADMLAVNFFASTGQLKGSFVQEIDPPWTIWWRPIEDQSLIGRLGTMIKGELPQPESVWESGTPNGECKEISWLDLFRKAVIKKMESRQVASEVILLTPDKEIFYAAVKKHFMLQQGQIEFAVFDSGKEYFLLKIQNPSLWVFNTLTSPDWVWYNLVPGQSGIYVETGWFIHDISGDSCFNQFQITENGILLIQKDGRLLTLKPKWKRGESLIRVNFAGPEIQQKEELEILSVNPVLRETEKRILPTLWKIEDQSRFKAILINESLSRFRNYQAVICKNGAVWVHARGKQADRGLASVLTDAFKAFTEIDTKVFVPVGKVLAPRLSSERLHGIMTDQQNDLIVIDEDVGGLVPTLINGSDMAPVEEFITLKIEEAVSRAEAIKSNWKFEFRDLKKKKQVVEVEIKTSAFEKLQATSDEGQVGTGASSTKKREKKTSINLADVPEPGTSELSSLRLDLEQIDRQLLQNVADSKLWQQRGELCRRMRLRISAIASMMNSALIAANNEELAECVFEYCNTRPEFKIMTAESVSEIDKGRLLAAIRKPEVNCEFHYLLMLAYAAKFDDPDIFYQAVKGMKTAFPGESRQFYGFNEIRVASGGGMNVENRVELLTKNDFSRISTNVRKFLLQLGCGRSISIISIARNQLHKLLSFHLSKNMADSLVSMFAGWNADYSKVELKSINRKNYDFISYFWALTDKWPESLEKDDLSPSLARWQKLLVMDKIRETPLKDFFTGDLYKPPYLFVKAEEGGKDGLLSVSWIDDLPSEQFPEVCDGRPIARAIYYRFADNNADWDDYFKKAFKSKNVSSISKTQRLLLLMVSEFGPHPAFQKYILPAIINADPKAEWDIYDLTMYCDMYRLSLAYKRPIDEQRLFNLLINRIPQPPNGWEDFKNSAEWIILCLLLSSSPVRRFQLDNLIVRVMSWLYNAERQGNYDMFAEALTVYSFLCIGVLADLVPEKLELHQLLEKRKVIWMEHAFATSAQGEAAFRDWQEACGY